MAEKYSTETIIKAITDAKGNLTLAAKSLGCSRTTIHRYVNQYATVRAVYEEMNETAIDFVENRLMKAIDEGNITAIIFFLKTKARHRGYVERHEVTGKDGGELVFRVIRE
jgi:hypothetical protein